MQWAFHLDGFLVGTLDGEFADGSMACDGRGGADGVVGRLMKVRKLPAPEPKIAA